MMLRITLVYIGILLLSACKQPVESGTPEEYLLYLGETYACQDNAEERITAYFSTSLGDFSMQLLCKAAPVTVQNFMNYMELNFFENTLVHKIDEGFVIRMGSYNDQGELKSPAFPPIPNESDHGLQHRRGTVAMVRYQHPDSATSEFLINIGDNPLLSINNGYTIFAIIDSGMDVVDRIAEQQAANRPIVISKTALIAQTCGN